MLRFLTITPYFRGQFHKVSQTVSGNIMPPVRRGKDVSWGEVIPLEQWVAREIRGGRETEVFKLLRTLPEHRKRHYRELFLKIRREELSQ